MQSIALSKNFVVWTNFCSLISIEVPNAKKIYYEIIFLRPKPTRNEIMLNVLKSSDNLKVANKIFNYVDLLN